MNIVEAFKEFNKGFCIKRKIWEEYCLRPDPRFKNHYNLWYYKSEYYWSDNFNLNINDFLAEDWEIDEKMSEIFKERNLEYLEDWKMLNL